MLDTKWWGICCSLDHPSVLRLLQLHPAALLLGGTVRPAPAALCPGDWNDSTIMDSALPKFSSGPAGVTGRVPISERGVNADRMHGGCADDPDG